MSKILCIKCQLTSRIWGPNTDIAAAQTRRCQHLLPDAPCPHGGCHTWTASKASCMFHPSAAKLSTDTLLELAMGLILWGGSRVNPVGRVPPYLRPQQACRPQRLVQIMPSVNLLTLLPSPAEPAAPTTGLSEHLLSPLTQPAHPCPSLYLYDVPGRASSLISQASVPTRAPSMWGVLEQHLLGAKKKKNITQTKNSAWRLWTVVTWFRDWSGPYVTYQSYSHMFHSANYV